MKIYADSKHSLAYFVASNLWVKAIQHSDNSIIYVRIHKALSFIECNIVPEDAVFSNVADFQAMISNVVFQKYDSFSICQPEETLRTDELLQKFFPEAKSSLKLLSQFEGKEIWVACRIFGAFRTDSRETYYIKVCNIIPTAGCTVVRYELINTRLYGLRPSTLQGSYIEDIEVIQPLELLTTEELEEILNEE